MAILLSQSDYSMVCCGIKNISENFIAFSALYSSNSSFIVYDKIEKDMNWLRKSAYVQSLDMKITDTGKPLFLSLTSSLALARTENQKKSQISLQRADTTVLTYDLINNFNLELATNEFDDSALQNKKSPAYQQFLKKITIYINKQITIDMPFLIKNIIAINYENFTVNLTAIPFEYNKELIILTPVGKCFLPDLCGGSILKCKKNSFCYQFFSSVYCLCDPGFGLIDSICVPEGITINET
ncbi:hypothetical protein HZS_700 [Henneguya salminicola]|nr:hypothetical protein HZS_700 [Henneguya salminicola]